MLNDSHTNNIVLAMLSTIIINDYNNARSIYIYKVDCACENTEWRVSRSCDLERIFHIIYAATAAHMIGQGSAITAVTPSLIRFKALRVAAGVAKNISDAITMITIRTGSVNFCPPTVLFVCVCDMCL